MTATLAALLLAHALADFVLQTARIAAGKAQRQPWPFAQHILAVLATALFCLAPLQPAAALPLVLLTLGHAAIDLAKSFLPATLRWFLIDQAAHLALIATLAALWPGLWAAGAWAALPALPWIMALLAGLILATRAGGFAIGLLMRPWVEEMRQAPGAPAEGAASLTHGGLVIGLLERGLIYLLIVVNQPAGIGFLIAAKSVLRFESARDLRAGEYVIIGTLASFGWALIAGYGARALALALGFPGVTP